MNRYRLISTSSLFATFLLVFYGGKYVYSQNDSIETGVMKVRRPPVPSTYYVDFVYSYSPAKQGFLAHLFKRKSDGQIAYLPA